MLSFRNFCFWSLATSRIFFPIGSTVLASSFYKGFDDWIHHQQQTCLRRPTENSQPTPGKLHLSERLKNVWTELTLARNYYSLKEGGKPCGRKDSPIPGNADTHAFGWAHQKQLTWNPMHFMTSVRI
jgi:hypothetical protein